ncbi:hypothetical protein HHI36_008197 [Cryptolaemus montrouzieri]|uniref:Reverse transcriptase n=1 Tax=Cryptolaemus montrouzieri TaxID=559131 RepID=A0ABD2MRN3_9CUCU
MSGNSDQELKDAVCRKLDDMEEYFKNNFLKLNVEKTQLVKYSYSRHQGKLQLNFDRYNLESQSHIKFLGMEIDHKMDWRIHIDNLIGQLSRYCYALRISSMEVCKETAIIAYNFLSSPVFDME